MKHAVNPNETNRAKAFQLWMPRTATAAHPSAVTDQKLNMIGMTPYYNAKPLE